MDIKLFSFLNKKDKEDTITAMVVVLFFMGLGAYLIDFSQLTDNTKLATNLEITPENQVGASIQTTNDSMKSYTSIEEWIEVEGEPVADDELVVEGDENCLPRNPSPTTTPVPTKDSVSITATNAIAKDSMETPSAPQPLPDTKPREEMAVLPQPTPIDSPKKELPKKEVSQRELSVSPSTPTQRTIQPQPAEIKKAAPVAKPVAKPQPTTETAYDYCVVMIGSFKSKENVDKLLQELKQAGYKGYKINRNDLISVGVYVDCNNPKPVFDKMTKEYGTGVWLLKAKK
ncbi:MAG: SPOR domain-containing protein [Bacteroidia bacterium]